MATKAVLVALVLVALMAGHAAAGESAHAVPLRRTVQSLGWMHDMRGRPSVTAATTAHRRAMIGEELRKAAITLVGRKQASSSRPCRVSGSRPFLRTRRS